MVQQLPRIENAIAPSQSAIARVTAALHFLAGRCDGAARQDDIGFNGADSTFGRDLANSEKLSPRQLRAAYDMMRKYDRTQLEPNGYALPAWDRLLDEISMQEIASVKRSPSRPAIKRSIDSNAPEPYRGKREAASDPLEAIVDDIASLGTQQKEVFDLALDWFEQWHYGSDPFVLKGYAGTGKSYTVQTIVKAIALKRDRTLRVALCAYTNKAVAVLADFAEAAKLRDFTSQVYITTYSSLYHLMPGESDEKGHRPQVLNAFSQSPHARDFDLVIVDEISMIGQELFDFAQFDRAPHLCMGDPAQLPPVEKDNPEPIPSPFWSLPIAYELTEVRRYEGAIAEYVGRIRGNLDTSFSTPRTQGNLEALDYEEWMAAAIESFRAGVSTRILAPGNDQVDAYNKIVRAALRPNISDRYAPGDRLVAKEPVIKEIDGRRETILKTCQEVVILDSRILYGPCRGDAKKVIGDLPIKLYRLECEAEGSRSLTIHVLHEDSMPFVSAAIGGYKKGIDSINDKTEKKHAWNLFYQMLQDFNLVSKKQLLDRLQYSFATTIHQSQGSTYKNAFVDAVNIQKYKNTKQRNQLLYVACSRASDRLFLRA